MLRRQTGLQQPHAESISHVVAAEAEDYMQRNMRKHRQYKPLN